MSGLSRNADPREKGRTRTNHVWIGPNSPLRITQPIGEDVGPGRASRAMPWPRRCKIGGQSWVFRLLSSGRSGRHPAACRAHRDLRPPGPAGHGSGPWRGLGPLARHAATTADQPPLPAILADLHSVPARLRVCQSACRKRRAPPHHGPFHWRAASPSGQPGALGAIRAGCLVSPANRPAHWRNPVPAAAKGAITPGASTAATARRRCLCWKAMTLV